MIVPFITLITAIIISIAAIYYSVSGLMTIFAGAAFSVMIMGTILEIGKLVTVIWLHKYWHESVWWLKTYLCIAVFILMLITSLGIFGGLSKAHIDQTATATESIALIEQIELQIAQDREFVVQSEQKIQEIRLQGSNQDSQLQEQIDREQARIDSAYARIQPSIDEQNTIIKRFDDQKQTRIDSLNREMSVVDQQLESLRVALESNNVRLAQGIVGVRQDGSLGPGTERAIQQFRDQKNNSKNELKLQIDALIKMSDPQVDQARLEIQRLRSIAEKEIADSNLLISRLRSQLGTTDTAEQDKKIAEQQSAVQTAQQRIETNIQKKFELESEYRKLEAEVGPVKYLAEFVYGTDADKNLLEEAVRWVIVLIIFVFDPLAVLLLIASQYSFKIHQENKNNKKTKDEEKYNIIKPEEPIINERVEQPIVSTNQEENDVEPDDTIEENSSADVNTNLQDQRLAYLLEKESDEKWKLAKIKWKIDNPRANTKMLRQQYLDGKIDQLPWEEYFKNSYVQNSEQSEHSIFTKIQQSKND